MDFTGDQAQSDGDAKVTRGLDAQFADGNVAFADGFPFLLTSEVMLCWLVEAKILGCYARVE